MFFLSFSSNDAPFGEYGVSNVVLTASTSGQLISRSLNFDIIRSGGNLGTTQVTVNITYDQVRKFIKCVIMMLCSTFKHLYDGNSHMIRLIILSHGQLCRNSLHGSSTIAMYREAGTSTGFRCLN